MLHQLVHPLHRLLVHARNACALMADAQPILPPACQPCCAHPIGHDAWNCTAAPGEFTNSSFVASAAVTAAVTVPSADAQHSCW